MRTSKRSTHPLRRDPRVEVDLADDGILFMINVVLFHPRGLALCQHADGRFAVFGDGSERWVFSEEGAESADNDAKWAAFSAMVERAKSAPAP